MMFLSPMERAHILDCWRVFEGRPNARWSIEHFYRTQRARSKPTQKLRNAS